MQKPKVEHVSGLSPAISIEQKTTSKSPRSTVGTVTEVYDYLRILYARLGSRTAHVPDPIGTQTADEIIAKILSLPEGTKTLPDGAPERKGQEKYETLFDEVRRAGFVRLLRRRHIVQRRGVADYRSSPQHNVEVVVDRVIVRTNQRTRIADAVESGARSRARRQCTSPTFRKRKRSRSGSRPLQPALCLRSVRSQFRAAQSASLLVQQPARNGVRRARVSAFSAALRRRC